MHLLFRLIAILTLVLGAPSVQAQERIALVIGNGAYQAVAPLRNPENDAADIAAALQRLNFDVTLHLNLDGRDTSRALRDFARLSDTADMAVIYFAGHGLEIDNQNYLLPVDAQIERAQDTSYEATPMSQLLSAVVGAETLRLVLLDECRNNPFLARMADGSTRSLGRGLALVEPAGGVLVSYAAKGGTVAYDGEGRNSPYAAALLAHLEQPGLEIGKLFHRVRDAVYSATNGQQEPFTYGSLPARDIYLSAARSTQDAQDKMLRAFARADIANSAMQWDAFLDQFADLGLFPEIIARARQKRSALLQPAAQVQPAPTAGSPLIRACDALAADPDDPGRPADVAGVARDDINHAAAIQACVLATSGHPDHMRSLYQLGRVQSVGPAPGAAEPYLAQAATGGYVSAQIALAQFLFADTPDSQKRARGTALLKQATAAGSAMAPRLLADYMRRDSYFAGAPMIEIVDLYTIAAERGDGPAQYEAGYRMISRLNLTPQDRETAIRYLTTADKAGDQRALPRLINYYLSQGGPDNTASARALLQGAAAEGQTYALARLVQENLNGRHWPRDFPAAARWLKLGARKGNTAMQVEYGYVLETGRGVKKLPNRAADYYMLALMRGNNLAIARAGDDWDFKTARAIQNRLKTSQVARYTGPIDGVIGNGTRAAMLRLCKCARPSRQVKFSDRFY